MGPDAAGAGKRSRSSGPDAAGAGKGSRVFRPRCGGGWKPSGGSAQPGDSSREGRALRRVRPSHRSRAAAPPGSRVHEDDLTLSWPDFLALEGERAALLVSARYELLRAAGCGAEAAFVLAVHPEISVGNALGLLASGSTPREVVRALASRTSS